MRDCFTFYGNGLVNPFLYRILQSNGYSRITPAEIESSKQLIDKLGYQVIYKDSDVLEAFFREYIQETRKMNR